MCIRDRKITLEDNISEPIELVAGVDLAFIEDLAIAACVSVSYDNLTVFEEATAIVKLKFPYIPGFLSFREAFGMVVAFRKLKKKPQVLMVNAHGIAHPRFCGCASHVGVVLKIPTIGIAKNKLCGEYSHEPVKVGDYVPLTYMGYVVGVVYKSKVGCKPIFISPGHMISLETSIKIVRHFLKGYKFPEPVRLAHNLANKVRSEIQG